MVAMLKGSKRYILNPPESCPLLSIIADTRHPSFRHSSVDWSDIQYVNEQSKFAQVRAVETIVRAGEVLYIPSFWFHYIVSLEYSIQCNSRSGSWLSGTHYPRSCYFLPLGRSIRAPPQTFLYACALTYSGTNLLRNGFEPRDTEKLS